MGIIKLILQIFLIFPATFQKIKSILKHPEYFYSYHLGPIISPKPGPTFDIALAAPDTAVTKSRPVRDSNNAIIKKINKKEKIKVITDFTKSSEIF